LNDLVLVVKHTLALLKLLLKMALCRN